MKAVPITATFALLSALASAVGAQTAPPGYAQPGPQPGYAQPAPQPGYAQPGPQPGYAQPAPQPGYAQPAPQPGYAQPAPQPGYYGPPGPQPVYYGPPAPPPPVASPGARTHDGFYMHFGTGLGYLSDSERASGITSTDVKWKGMAFAFEFALGGTPAPGLVIGGMLTGTTVPSPTVESGGISVTTSNVSLSMVAIGPLITYYVDPTGGFFLRGMVGYGQLSASDNSGNTTTNNPVGVVANFGLGHEWWVADQWSLGVLGSFSYASLKYSQTVLNVTAEDKHSVISPSVQFSATYH
jgi:hypothetical protein